MTPSRFQRLKGQVLKVSQQSSEVINVVHFTIIKLSIILQYFYVVLSFSWVVFRVSQESHCFLLSI